MDFPRDSFIRQLDGCNSQFRFSIIEYTDNLIKQGLPVIFSLKHLAGIVSVEYSELISIKATLMVIMHILQSRKNIVAREGG